MEHNFLLMPIYMLVFGMADRQAYICYLYISMSVKNFPMTKLDPIKISQTSFCKKKRINFKTAASHHV